MSLLYDDRVRGAAVRPNAQQHLERSGASGEEGELVWEGVKDGKML